MSDVKEAVRSRYAGVARQLTVLQGDTSAACCGVGLLRIVAAVSWAARLAAPSTRAATRASVLRMLGSG